MSQRSYNLFIFAAVMLTAVGAAVGGVLAIVYDPIWLTLTLVCGTAALAFLVELVISLVRSRGRGKKKVEAEPAQGEDAVAFAAGYGIGILGIGHSADSEHFRMIGRGSSSRIAHLYSFICSTGTCRRYFRQ